jgi:hypothetical protein
MSTSDIPTYRPVGPANRKKGHLDLALVFLAIVCAALIYGAGDCEDMSFLFASVIEAMGYDAVILLYGDHVADGVACTSAIGTYYNLDSSKYFYCETTASGWELGRAPRECGSARVIQVE